MKRSIALALIFSAGLFVGSVAISPAMAHCGTCGVGDAPKKEACPECEKMEDGHMCPKCEAKKKKDEHDHKH